MSESNHQENGASQEPFLARLSIRERQILVRAAKGQTDQAIANGLGISLGTVGTYWGRIRGKLGHFNRTELVAQYLKKSASEVLGELRGRNQDLEDAIEVERERVTHLAANLQIVSAIISAFPEAILVVNEEGKILFANDDASGLFGYTKEELAHLHVIDLMPERFRTVHDQHRQAYLALPIKKRMGEHLATLALRKDGTEFPIATSLSSTRSDHGLLVTCIVRDLTEDIAGGEEEGDLKDE